MAAGEGFPEFPEFFAVLEIGTSLLVQCCFIVHMESDSFLRLLLSLLQQPALLTGAIAQVKKVSYI